MSKYLFLPLLMMVFMSSGCYSFKGIAIPPDIKTFYVDNFQNNTQTAPGDINQRFSEALRAKIRNESRLLYNEQNPDVEFSGTISGFTLRPEAPQAGNTVALNRLDIIVTVKCTNHKDDKESWEKPFSFYQTFASDQDFISLQDSLISEIFKQLMENIFNEAFTGW